MWLRWSQNRRWQNAYRDLRRLAEPTPSRRRLFAVALIVGVQVAVLAVTYRAVVFEGRTLLTGAFTPQPDATAPPYGYPDPSLSSGVPRSNEIDPGASAWAFVPQIRKAHLELSSGQLPLWDANVMLGAPLAADVEHGLFNPLTWPLVASPTPGVWDVWLLARLLLAGLMCTWLAWYLGLRPLPATMAGLVYMMSGVFQVHATTIQTGIMALLPLLILAAERCVRAPTRWSAGLLAIAIALTVLFGMPEESVVCLLLAALYFIVRFAATWRGERRFPDPRLLYAGVGGALVGLLLSLPLVVPFAEYLAAGVTRHASGSHPALSVADARQLLSLVGPHWNVLGPRAGDASFAPMDNWFGAGAIFLALLGVFTKALPRGVRTLMVIVAIAVMAKTVGVPGWFNQLVGYSPVVGQITLWAYSGVVVSLAIAILAGAGLQGIVKRVITPRVVAVTALVLGGVVLGAIPTFLPGVSVEWRQVLIAASIFLVVIAVVSAAAVWARRGGVKPSDALAAIILIGALGIATAPPLLSGPSVRWDQISPTAALLLIVVAGALLAANGARLRSRLGVILAAGGVTVELCLLATPELPLAVRYDALSTTPTTAYLQQAMPSGTGRSYSPTGVLYPTTNQAFNLDDVRNLDPIYVERTYRYLKLFVDPGLTDRFDGLGPNAANITHNSFFDALNVKYILVSQPSFQSAGLPGSQFTLEHVAPDGVRIYRNQDAAPRAQVIFDATSVTSEDAAATAMSHNGFDPTKSVVVETPQALPRGDHTPVAVLIDSYNDSRIVITTNTSEPGTLVVADAYYPGWQATVDGSPMAIYPADVALRGVVVPAGVHKVTMEYRPQSVAVGALGVPAGLIALGLGGWVFPPALRTIRRRRKAAPAAQNAHQ